MVAKGAVVLLALMSVYILAGAVVRAIVLEPAHKCVQMIALMAAKKHAEEVANILVEAVVLIAICINNGLF